MLARIPSAFACAILMAMRRERNSETYETFSFYGWETTNGGHSKAPQTAPYTNTPRLLRRWKPKRNKNPPEKKIRRSRDPKAESKIGLPDLDQSRAAVIGSLPSPEYNKTR